MTKPTVLFLCTGNSCRSQMAEGFANALHHESLTAVSAGTRPQSLNQLAVAVMKEVGIDISQHQPKNVSVFAEEPIAAVVSVCGHAGETCPVFLGDTTRIHHGFDDPPRLADGLAESDALPIYRRVRDEIKAYIETLPVRISEARAANPD